jgi:hypothetical protein
MTNLDLAELKHLIEVYVCTLNDDDRVEWYTTHRGNATGQLGRFVKWIERDGRTRREEAERVAAEDVAVLENDRPDTGHAEADRIIGRLASSDPDFDDCTDAAVLIRRLVADAKGPDGYATWKDAAIAERVRRIAEGSSAEPAMTHTVLRQRWCDNCGHDEDEHLPPNGRCPPDDDARSVGGAIRQCLLRKEPIPEALALEALRYLDPPPPNRSCSGEGK